MAEVSAGRSRGLPLSDGMMVGCGATPQDGGESPGETSGSEPDEVGTVSQPLGGFQDLFHDERDASPGSLTATYAFFTTYAPNTDCTNEMIFVNRSTGSSTDVPFDI